MKEQEELEQRVIALWQEGRSQADIGCILSVSRHVIAGTIYRLRRRGVMLEKRTLKGDKTMERKEKRHGDLALLMSMFHQLAPAEIVEPAEDAEDGFFVFDLPQNGCKWPIGMRDGRHTFCGKERGGANAYCELHARKAYGKAERKGFYSNRHV